jgi:hypothetical protein
VCRYSEQRFSYAGTVNEATGSGRSSRILIFFFEIDCISDLDPKFMIMLWIRGIQTHKKYLSGTLPMEKKECLKVSRKIKNVRKLPEKYV